MNTLVNFLLAKLLKERGYSWECENFYRKGTYHKEFHLTTGTEYDSDRNCIWDWNLNGGKSGMLSKVIPYPNEHTATYYSAPTIAEVVMWLYEKHGVWIEVYYDNSRKEFYTVLNGEELKFNSPTAAYEAAIEYTLNKLI